jgi:phospholipase D1/2
MTFFSDLKNQVTDLFNKKDGFEATDDDVKEQQILQEHHRHDSFASVRHNAQVKFYIDGQNYCW